MGKKTPVATSSVLIDQLSYTYLPGSNKLQKVTDAANDSSSVLGDFKYLQSAKSDTDYVYDLNGNVIADKNKNISNIAYNILNLPQTITVAGKGTITYTYDAAGNKLRKQTVEGARNTTTLYAGGIVYENDTLRFIPHEEGRLRINNNNYVFDYYLKDHLGNVRMTITDDNTATSPVIDATSYYPFGLVMSGLSIRGLGKLENKFKYNGGNELQNREFSDGSGLEMYDAVHRMYDGQIGRFHQIDALSDVSLNKSTYSFGGNNPIILNDPLGLKEDTVRGESSVTVKSVIHRTPNFINWPSSTPSSRAEYDRNENRFWGRVNSGQEVSQNGDPASYSARLNMYKRWHQEDRNYRSLQAWALGILSTPVMVSISPSAIFSALRMKLQANVIVGMSDFAIQAIVNRGILHRSILDNWNPVSTTLAFGIGSSTHTLANNFGVSLLNSTLSSSINLSAQSRMEGTILSFDASSIILNAVFGTAAGSIGNQMKVDFKNISLGEAASQSIIFSGAVIDEKNKDN